MAEEVDALDEGGAGKAGAAAGGKKKKMVIGAAAALLVLGSGGGYYMMHKSGHKGAKVETAESAKPVYVDVPAMVVNLRSSDGQQHFMKLHFVLVPAEGVTEQEVRDRLPVILDAYQPFLRELRPEDVAGSAAVFRLKEELLIRAGDAFGKGRIRDILIQDMIQQ